MREPSGLIRLLGLMVVICILVLIPQASTGDAAIHIETQYSQDSVSTPTPTLTDTLSIPIITDPGDQRFPALAHNTRSKEFLLVWESGSASNAEVCAQLLSPNGKTKGTPCCFSSGSKSGCYPDVVYNDARNEYMIVWRKMVPGEAGAVCGRIVSSTLGLVRSFTIEEKTGFWSQAAVACNPDDGTYYVAWINASTQSDGDIWGQLLEPDGKPLSQERRLCKESGPKTGVDVALVALDAEHGKFLVAWEDHRDSASQGDVYYQRVNADDGRPGGDDVRVRHHPSHQGAPALAQPALDYAGLLVWQDNSLGGGCDIWRKLLLSGTPETVCQGKAEQLHPAAASDMIAGYLVVWQDNRNGISDDIHDIYAQCVCEDIVAGDWPLCDADGDQSEPVICFNSLDRSYLVMWQDNRDGDYDLYGTLVRSCAVTPTPTITPTSTHTPVRLHIPLVLRPLKTPTPTNTQTTPTPTDTPTPTATSTCEWKRHDDGKDDYCIGGGKVTIRAVRFTVPSPRKVVTLRYYLCGIPDAAMSPLRFLVLDNGWGKVYDSGEVVDATGGWFNWDVSDNAVTVDGDFFVAIQWPEGPPPGLGKDMDPAYGQSYSGQWTDSDDEDGSGMYQILDANYMIRVCVRSSP